MSIHSSIRSYRIEDQTDGSCTSLEFDKENRIPYQGEPRSVLSGSFQFTPRFLNKSNENNILPKSKSRASLNIRQSKEFMLRSANHSFSRNILKRNFSIISQKQEQSNLVPLGDELQEVSTEPLIEDCSIPVDDNFSNVVSAIELKPSNATIFSTLTTESVRNIAREEIRSHFLTLKLSDRFVKREEITTNSSMLTDMEVSNSSDKEAFIETEADQKCSEPPDSTSISEIHDSDFQDLLSNQHFMRMQIGRWKKQILNLLQQTETIEKLAFHSEDAMDPMVPAIYDDFELTVDTEISSIVTADNITAGIDPLLNSSLKAACSQLDYRGNELDSGSLESDNLLLRKTYSCYTKMSELDQRLSDIEIQMSSIHVILSDIRQQQYKELVKLREKEHDTKAKQPIEPAPAAIMAAADETIPEIVGDGSQVGKRQQKEELETLKPPLVTCDSEENREDSETSLTAVNQHDEIYYEWRQYRMNLLHYKKSDRTIALNNRPTLKLIKPLSVLKNSITAKPKNPVFVTISPPESSPHFLREN